jgi:ADP-ribose pyrophosphatase
MVKKWVRKSSESLNYYKIFKTRKDISVSPKSGSEHEFYVIESSDWVNVIAVTENDEIVFIKQYRHGVMETTLEIPGGTVDNGEVPLESAKRELLEETGYTSDTWIQLGIINPNPAILNNNCYSFLALNSQKTHSQKLDGTEDIEVVMEPATNVDGLIMNKQITHSLVICAFYFYEKYKNSV